MKRWFLIGMAGILSVAAVYAAGGAMRTAAPLPNPHGVAYKGANDLQTLYYTRDAAGQLQKEHLLILELLDELKAKIDRLEKKIESSKISS